MASPVIGAEELRRALVEAGTSFNSDMRKRLRFFAEPVRTDAELLAQSRIRTVGIPWSRMRTGVAAAGSVAAGGTAGSVYVAPVQRGTRILSKRRPRFGTMLMRRAMEPALEKNRQRILDDVDALLARMERKFGSH